MTVEAHDIDVVIPMSNLIEYSDNYWKKLGILWQYWRDKLVVNDNGSIADFNAANDTISSFKIKEKITDKTDRKGRKDVEIMVPSKHLSNSLGTLEILLINCKINLDLNWP